MRINLTDNNQNRTDNIYDRHDIANLFPISDKTIAELCKENENLLIFPHSIETSKDRIGSSSIINILNTNNPDKVRIVTENILGFIGAGNLQIKIKSRFDKQREDYFLHYMLQKVLSLNIFDLTHNNDEEEILDFTMFLFPYYLKNALRQGVYREYRNFKHNDTKLKGTIDVSKHIKNNIPFVGNFAYSTREYSQDNDMMQLIRHTIEYMQTRQYGQAILKTDIDTIENVKLVIEHTPSYNKAERSNIITRNLRNKNHPYYTEYTTLQILCLQILRMEDIKYGDNNDEICGVLFDGAWLWEEYINTILSKHGFTHPENKLQKGCVYLFEDRSGIRYPDFYKKDIVFDAKYKQLENYERVSKVDRNDLHQIITYMNNLKSKHGGFIAPLLNKQTIIPTSILKDSTSTISIHGIVIPQSAHSYTDFVERMKENEMAFIDSIINPTLP